MRTTVDLPEPLLRNAKKRAATRGVTLSTIVEDALRSLLSPKKALQRTEFQLPTVRGQLRQPGIDLDRTSALISEDDETEFQVRGQKPGN